MKTFEIEFKTAIKNRENRKGNWFNYYKAETAELARDMLISEMQVQGIEVIEIIKVTESKR